MAVARVGVRVVRGPEWGGIDEDGGDGGVGTIVSVPDGTSTSEPSIVVQWDMGEKEAYSEGRELRLFDTSQTGSFHPGSICSECGMEGIVGIRWCCTVCRHTDLCSDCYHAGRHDLDHQFWCFPFEDGRRISIAKRNGVSQVKLLGIFKGATVSRGIDWPHGDQDGGRGNLGTVVELQDNGSSTYNSLCIVVWKGRPDEYFYRVGDMGRVDLCCVKSGDGQYCYCDLLPTLTMPIFPAKKTQRGKKRVSIGYTSSTSDASRGPLSHDDSNASLDPQVDTTLSHQQSDKSLAWQSSGDDADFLRHASHTEVLVDEQASKTSQASHSHSQSDRQTRQEYHSAATNTGAGSSGPDVASMTDSLAQEATPFQPGSLAMVANIEVELLQSIQQDGLHNWESSMAQVINRVGEVIDGDQNRGFRVKYTNPNKSFTFYSAILSTVERFQEGDEVTMVDDLQMVKTFLSGYGGWSSHMQQYLGRRGLVVRIQPHNFEVVVQFGSYIWRFHPACLQQVGSRSQIPGDIRAVPEFRASNTSHRTGCINLGGVSDGGVTDTGDEVQSDAGNRTPRPPVNIDGYSSSTGHALGGGDQTDYSDSDVPQKHHPSLSIGGHRHSPASRRYDSAPAGIGTRSPQPQLQVPGSGGNQHEPEETDSRQQLLQMVASQVRPGETKSTARSTPRKTHATAADDPVLDLARAIFDVDVDAVHELAPRYRDQINTTITEFNVTTVHMAAISGNVDILQILIDNGGDVEVMDQGGDTPMHKAARKDAPHVITCLHQAQADVNSLNHQAATPLHAAAYHGSYSAVRELLRLKAKVNEMDSEEDTPLFNAVWVNRGDIVDILLAAGSRPHETNSRGFNAIHHAAFKGSRFALERLIAAHPDLINSTKPDGYTPLHITAINNHIPATRVLVQHSFCKLDARDEKDHTPLMLAVLRALKGTVELLVNSGANIDQEGPDGDTAVHLAVAQISVSKVTSDAFKSEEIRESGEASPDINALEELMSFSTPRENKAAAIACFLAQRGGDINYMNHRGYSPMDACAAEEIKALMAEHYRRKGVDAASTSDDSDLLHDRKHSSLDGDGEQFRVTAGGEQPSGLKQYHSSREQEHDMHQQSSPYPSPAAQGDTKSMEHRALANSVPMPRPEEAESPDLQPKTKSLPGNIRTASDVDASLERRLANRGMRHRPEKNSSHQKTDRTQHHGPGDQQEIPRKSPLLQEGHAQSNSATGAKPHSSSTSVSRRLSRSDGFQGDSPSLRPSHQHTSAGGERTASVHGGTNQYKEVDSVILTQKQLLDAVRSNPQDDDEWLDQEAKGRSSESRGHISDSPLKSPDPVQSAQASAAEPSSDSRYGTASKPPGAAKGQEATPEPRSRQERSGNSSDKSKQQQENAGKGQSQYAGHTAGFGNGEDSDAERKWRDAQQLEEYQKAKEESNGLLTKHSHPAKEGPHGNIKDDVNSEASHQHNGYRDHHRQQHQQQQQQQQQQPMNRLGSGSGSTQSSNRSQVASSHMNQLSHPNSSNQRTATSSATHSSDDHEQHSGNVYNIPPTSRTTTDYALSSNVHQAVRAVPTSGGMISDYGDGEEFKPEQLRSLVNSFACQSDNSPAIRLVKAIRSGSIESARSTFLELRDSLDVRVTHQLLSCAHIAVLHGSLPMLQVLISCGADTTVADCIGNTPLHFAARIGSSPIIHELITNSPAEIDVLNLKLVTALHFAALEGQHEAVQQLLVLDANVNLKDCEGNTPLHNAAWSNHVKILEMLLDAGADMSITNEKTFNVVHHACYQGNSWPVLRLLRRRPEMVNSIMEKGMYSPLHIAANNNHYSTAEVLLKEPLCHKDAVDHNLHTPLMLAVRRGVKACTELLVAFGADLEMQDQQGSTVLHLAVDNLQEDTRVMSSFIEIDVDESGERSPHINQIQMSIASGNPIEDRVAGIACFLVQEGCSVMKQNWHNQTPLDICFEPRVAAHLRRFDQRRGEPKVRGLKKPRAKGDDAPTRTAAVPSGNFRDLASRHSDVQPGEVSADEALAAATASSVAEATRERFPDCRLCDKAGGASIMFLPCRDNVVCPDCSQLLETCNVCDKHIEEKYLLDKPRTTSHRRTPVFKEKCIVCDDAPATVSFDPCYDTITCPRCCYRLKTCENCGVLIKGRYENNELVPKEQPVLRQPEPTFDPSIAGPGTLFDCRVGHALAVAPLSSTASASTAGSGLSVNFEVFVKDVDSPYSRGLTEFSRRASEEGLQVRVQRNSLQDNDSMEVVSLTVEFSKTETNVTAFLKLLGMLVPTDVETDYVTETSFNEPSLRTVMSLITRLLEDFKSSENVVPAALLCISLVVHTNTVQYIHSEGGFYLDIVFTMMHAVRQALQDGTGNVAQAVDRLLPFIGNNSTIDTDKYNMKPLDVYLQEYKRLLQGGIPTSSSDEQDISEGAHRQVLSPEAKETEKRFGKKGFETNNTSQSHMRKDQAIGASEHHLSPGDTLNVLATGKESLDTENTSHLEKAKVIPMDTIGPRLSEKDDCNVLPPDKAANSRQRNSRRSNSRSSNSNVHKTHTSKEDKGGFFKGDNSQPEVPRQVPHVLDEMDKENIAARSETGSVKPLSGGQSLHPDKAAMLAKASDILPVLTPSPEPPSPATRTTKAKPELSQFPSDTDVGNVTQSVTDTILKSSRRAIVSPDNESQTQREHKRSELSQFPSDTDVGNVTQSVTDTILKSSRSATVSPDNESRTQREHKRPELSQFPSDTDVGNVTQSVTDTILKSSRSATVSPDTETRTQREHKRPDAGFTDSVKAHDASLPKADGNGDKKDLDSKPADGIVTPASAASVPGHVDVQLTASDLIRAGVTVMKTDDGYTNVRRVQISIVGRCGTGKTSFVNALKRQDFNEGQQSTLLFTTEHTCVFRRQLGLESTDKTPADYLARELVSIARNDKLLSAADSHYQPDPGNGLSDVVEKPVTQQLLSGNDRTVSMVQSSSSGSDFNGSVQQSSVQLPAAISAHLSNSIPTSSTDHGSANSEGKSTAPYQQQRQHALQSGREKTTPPVATPDPVPDFWKDFLETLASSPAMLQEIPDDDVIVSVFDYGGQSVFSSLQHIFMGHESSICIICIDGAQNLEDKGTDQVFHRGQNLEPIRYNEKFTNLEHLQQWLTAIYFTSKKYDTVPSPSSSTTDTMCGNKFELPPVLIVATHADEVQQKCHVSVDDRRRELWDSIHHGCHRLPMFDAMQSSVKDISTKDAYSLFMVDNTASKKGGDLEPEMRRVCDRIWAAIHDIVKSPDAKRMKKTWVRFELVLKHLENEVNSLKGRNMERRTRRDLPKGYISRKRICELARKACGIDNESEIDEMLADYHQTRRIYCQPLSGANGDGVVVFNMMWLVDQISNLMFGESYRSQSGNYHADRAREFLKVTGVLTGFLIDAVLEHDRVLRNVVISVMKDANLLYAPEGLPDDEDDAFYFVPSVLENLDTNILEEMKHTVCDETRMTFTMADNPLLISVQKHDFYGERNYTPLPHSVFVRLLVALMKKWSITLPKRREDMRVFYNAAWITVPNPAVGLINCNAIIRLFLAHFHVSGAILVNVQFSTHPCQLDKIFLLQDDSQVSVAELCSNVRKIIIDTLKDLRFPTLPGMDEITQYVLPMHPCSDQLKADNDLGNCPWKVRYTLEDSTEHREKNTGKVHFAQNVYCRDCGKLVRPNANAFCWFDKDKPFEPNTPSNSKACFMLYQHTAEENARRQLDRVTAAEAFPPQPEGATRSLYYVDSRVLGGGDSLPLQRGPASIFEQSSVDQHQQPYSAPVGVPESILSSKEIEEIASNHVIQDRAWEAITILPEQTGTRSAWSKHAIEKEAEGFGLTNQQMLLKHFFTKWSDHPKSSRQMLLNSLGPMETQDSLRSEMVQIITKYTV